MSVPALPISVVIPAHDRQDLIARAVQSAQRQRPAAPAEIIVVDDCSSDATGAVAEALGASVIRHPVNRGEAGARGSVGGRCKIPFRTHVPSGPLRTLEHMFLATKQRLQRLLDVVDDMLVGAPEEEIETAAPHPHARTVELRIDRRPGSVPGRPAHCLSPVQPVQRAPTRRAVAPAR